ncbi:UDP-N-acetylmuramate dehydrogenase (plasmid) [Agrobacterium sp. MA01]|nr:UDP-N-acetylmuramate dehydrogenase [Agrobacterium sp. MA01]
MLERVLPGRIQGCIDLAKMSRWRIGGTARYLAEPDTETEVARLLKLLQELVVPYLVIGHTSNLLFDDQGFDGVLVRLSSNFSSISQLDGSRVEVGGFAWTPAVAHRAATWGLGGVAHIVGIPGSFGGLIAMNGGSLRKWIGSHVDRVRVVTLDGTRVELSQKECGFSYRNSVFQEAGAIITSAVLALEPSDRHTQRQEMLKILQDRSKKFPRKEPNCGSVFLSNPDMYKIVGPPGKAIEEAGLKGYRENNARLSSHHANFIVNLGGATASDVLMLVHKARGDVYRNTGYLMDTEVKFVSRSGLVSSVHVEAERRFGQIVASG